MIDTSLALLITTREQQTPASTLWVIGEAPDEQITQILRQFPEDQIVSNRFISALVDHERYHFSDFKFAQLPETCQKPALILFRISKEKSLNQHVIAAMAVQLHADGTALIGGKKNEGIKSAQTIAQPYFANIGSKKHKDQYLISLSQALADTSAEKSRRESSQSAMYSDYQLIEHPDLAQPYLSKPGVFSWDHIDPGSAALWQVLQTTKPNFAQQAVLDIGCGSGLLSLLSRELAAAHITATDNNAAAIDCCRENFARFEIPGTVVPGSIADTVKGRFDVVVCNPPFHRGFAHEKGLIAAFVNKTADKLRSRGRAFFVVNQFVGLHEAVERSPLMITDTWQDGGFTIARLAKRKAT